jgi:hypothetical protein
MHEEGVVTPKGMKHSEPDVCAIAVPEINNNEASSEMGL